MNFPSLNFVPSSDARDIPNESAGSASVHYAYSNMMSQFLLSAPDCSAASLSHSLGDFDAFRMHPSHSPANNLGLYDDDVRPSGFQSSQEDNLSHQMDDILLFMEAFASPEFGKNGTFAPQLPSEVNSQSLHGTPATISLSEIQDSPYAGPSLSGMNLPQMDLSCNFPQSIPMSQSSPPQIKNEFSPFGNALRLFAPSQDVPSHSPLQFQPGLDFGFTVVPESSFPIPPPRLQFDENTLLSPIVNSTAQLFINNGLPSPLENCRNLLRGDHSVRQDVGSCIGMTPTFGEEFLNESDRCTDYASSSQSPQHMYPSPSPTPERAAVPLPHRSRKTPASIALLSRQKRHRPVRAAASRRKSYREPSEALSSASGEDPDSSVEDDVPPSKGPRSGSHAGSDSGADEPEQCKFGKKVWVFDDEKGRRVAKWECSKCSATMGRRPDLHRHYKSCTMREKHYCLPVVHADGSIWPGCGMTFSRRDACHRHLKRRLTEGRCSKTRPKQSMFSSRAEYEEKLLNYRDMLANLKWRAALPLAEKNRLAKAALPDIKQDIF
ncbi:hypothetical protein M0805_008608 [Coniferiporia weirii]|nr:hypothetical protein M0805_008608 [Coniferiporia weirii]